MSDLELLLLSKIATQEELNRIVPIFASDDEDDDEDLEDLEDDDEGDIDDADDIDEDEDE